MFENECKCKEMAIRLMLHEMGNAVGGFPMIDHSHMMMDKLMAIDLEEDGEMEEEPLGRCSDG